MKIKTGKYGSAHSLTHSMDSIGVGEDINRQMFIKTVHYKNNIYALKTVKSAPITRSLMLELKTLKDLQHMNIVRFLGASMEQGKALIPLKGKLSIFNFFSLKKRDFEKVLLKT